MKRKKQENVRERGEKNNNYQRQLGVHQMSFLFFVLLMTFSSPIVTSIKMSAHLWNSLVESSSQTSKYVCICVCAGVLCVRARVCVCKFHSNVLTFFGIQPSLRLWNSRRVWYNYAQTWTYIYAKKKRKKRAAYYIYNDGRARSFAKEKERTR